MKRKYLYALILLCCAHFCFAQDDLFEKYADMDGVTTVYISKKMFQMMPVVENVGLSLANMKGKVDFLGILSTENTNLRKDMERDFRALIGKEYEELMRVKDDSTRANFYVRQEGEQIKELIMLANTDSEGFTVIRLLGDFTQNDIQEIANTGE